MCRQVRGFTKQSRRSRRLVEDRDANALGGETDESQAEYHSPQARACVVRYVDEALPCMLVGRGFQIYLSASQAHKLKEQ